MSTSFTGTRSPVGGRHRGASRLLSSTRLSRQLAAIFPRESIANLPAAVDVPLHVIAGTADRLTPAWHAELIVRAAPHASLQRLPGVGAHDQLGGTRSGARRRSSRVPLRAPLPGRA